MLIFYFNLNFLNNKQMNVRELIKIKDINKFKDATTELGFSDIDSLYIWLSYHRNDEEIFNDMSFLTGDFDIDVSQKTVDKFKKSFEHTYMNTKSKKRMAFDPILPKYTIIEKNSVLFETSNSNSDIEYMDIFNWIILNEDVIFAKYNGIYKLYKNANISKKWISHTPEIVIYVSCKKNAQIIEDFVECKILLSGASLEKVVSEFNVSNDTLKTRIESIFPGGELKIKDTHEGNFEGYIYYLASDIGIKSYNRNVMLDIIMNELEQTPFIVDEKLKTAKEKTFVYLNYYNEALHLTSILNYRNNDAKDNNLLPSEFINNNYFQVSIKKIPSQKAYDSFVKDISYLFSTYIALHKNIQKDYAKFDIKLDDDTANYTIIPKQVKKYQNYPFFFKDYTKLCQKAFQPTEIGFDEKTNRPHLEYEDHKYICENDEYKFPGLKKNIYENKNEIPFVVCCYKTPSDNKKKQQQTTRAFITTSKILAPSQKGVIPNLLKRLFYVIDPTGEYVRIGVKKSNSSILNCLSTDPMSLLSQLQMNIVLSRQNNYSKSLSELKEVLSSNDPFIDARFYIDELESILDSYIYIFSENGFVTPHFKNGHYNNPISRPKTIFIFQNDYNNDNLPQYEIIMNQSNQTAYILSSTVVAERIKSIYDKLVTKYYVLNTEIESPNLSLLYSDTFYCKSQIIDASGKTRQFNYMYNGANVSLCVSPSFQLPVPEELSPFVHAVPVSDALKIFSEMGLNPTHKIGKTRAIASFDSVVQVIIHVSRIDMSVDLPTVDIPLQENESYSYLEDYTKTEKLARVLKQYVFWYYSKYITENSGKTLYDFISSKIKVDPNFKYDNEQLKSSVFSDKNPFVRNNKIILTSELLLKKVSYSLRNFIYYNKPEKYALKTYIPTFYLTKNDLSEFPSQIILNGELSVVNYIDKLKYKNVLSTKIKYGISPYFYKNKQIKNTVFIAQNTSSLEEAIEIGKIWYLRGYNVIIPNTNMESNDTIGFDIYTIDETNSTIPIIKDSNNIVIIGYKIQNKNYFTVLLDIQKMYSNPTVFDIDLFHKKIQKESDDIDIDIDIKIQDSESESVDSESSSSDSEGSDSESSEDESGIECKNIAFLMNENNSCYLDTTLVSLLSYPNTFIRDSILLKDVSTLPKEKQKTASAVQDEFKRIANANETVCIDLRKILQKYNKKQKVIDNIDFTDEQLEPYDVMAVLFDIFDVNPFVRWTQTRTLEQKEIAKVDKSDLYVQLALGDNTINLDDALRNQTTDDNYNIFMDYTDVPFLYVNINRRSSESASSKNKTQVIPMKTFEYNRRSLELSSIIIRRGENIDSGHYISYVLCNSNWYKYDDTSSSKKLKYVGSFEELLSRKEVLTESVAYFFM